MNTPPSNTHPTPATPDSPSPAGIRDTTAINVSPGETPSTAAAGITPGEASTPHAGLDAAARQRSGERALVLGGGGSTGNAWLLGVIAGLADAGLEVSRPDLTIGTSAGSTAAAQLAGATSSELYAAAAAPIPDEVLRRHQRPATAPGGNQRVRQAEDQLERTAGLVAESTDAADYRRRLGAAALDLLADNGLWPDRWRATVEARLPNPQWPAHRVLLTAVDATTGRPCCFDNDSGVELVDAVAASCASGLPYPIDGVPYLDGGYRRNENADLAAGHRRVLVLSPFGGRSRTPPAWGQQLTAQLEELRAVGSSVQTIFPESEELFGANAMDLSLRPRAAEAGHQQGRALAERVAEFWS